MWSEDKINKNGFLLFSMALSAAIVTAGAVPLHNGSNNIDFG